MAGETLTQAPADPAAGTAGAGDTAVAPADLAAVTELPRTGSSAVGQQVLFGLALMTAGLAAMVLGRRRRSSLA